MSETDEWVAVDEFGEVFAGPFSTEDEAWAAMGNTRWEGVGFAELAAEHEESDDEPPRHLIRIDTDNDRIVIGERTAFEVLGEGGQQLVVDHSSAADGYVAFVNPSDLDEEAMVQFRPVEARQ